MILFLLTEKKDDSLLTNENFIKKQVQHTIIWKPEKLFFIIIIKHQEMQDSLCMHVYIIVWGICVRTIHPTLPAFSSNHCSSMHIYIYITSFTELKIEYKSTVNHLKTRLPYFFDSAIVFCDHLHCLSNHTNPKV